MHIVDIIILEFRGEDVCVCVCVCVHAQILPVQNQKFSLPLHPSVMIDSSAQCPGPVLLVYCWDAAGILLGYC